MDEQKNEEIVLTPDEAKVEDSKETDKEKKESALDKLILDENDGVSNSEVSGEQVLKDSLEKASNVLIAFIRGAKKFFGNIKEAVKNAEKNQMETGVQESARAKYPEEQKKENT